MLIIQQLYCICSSDLIHISQTTFVKFRGSEGVKKVLRSPIQYMEYRLTKDYIAMLGLVLSQSLPSGLGYAKC